MNESQNKTIDEFKALIEYLPEYSRQITFMSMMIFGQYLDLSNQKDVSIWKNNCKLLEALLIEYHENPILAHALYALLVILKTDVQITFQKSSLDITETLERLKKKWQQYLAVIVPAITTDAINKTISLIMKDILIIYRDVQKKLLSLQKELADLTDLELGELVNYTKDCSAFAPFAEQCRLAIAKPNNWLENCNVLYDLLFKHPGDKLLQSLKILLLLYKLQVLMLLEENPTDILSLLLDFHEERQNAPIDQEITILSNLKLTLLNGTIQKSLALSEPEKIVEPLLQSISANFCQQIGVAIAQALLSSNGSLNSAIENDARAIRRLTILKRLTGKSIPSLTALLPLLYLYRYFLPTPSPYLPLDALKEFSPNFKHKQLKVPEMKRCFIDIATHLSEINENVHTMMTFFSLCKEALTLNDEILKSEVKKILVAYMENKKSVNVFEPVKANPKKNNKKNTAKKRKPAVKKIQAEEETPVSKRIREREIPGLPERKVTLFSPPEVFPRRAVHCVSLETTLKLMQKKHPTFFYRIKPRALITPVQDILDVFNSKANSFNNEKYRAAKTGSSVFGETKANDTDITVNCSLDEAQKLLTCVTGIQEITRIDSDYPILHITLTDYPSHPVEISALDNATQKPYLVLLNEKLNKSDYHPTSCAYLSFKNAAYIIDPNEGLKRLKEDKEKGITPKLRLTKHEHTPKNSSLIALRGMKFLATHHDFSPDEAFCSWLKENNHHLKHPGAIHPFVKLLLSGVAYDGLVKMKKNGLLQIVFPDLVEPLETNNEFIQRVRFFDQYSAQASRLATRENYWETVTKTLAFLFYPLKILPPALDEATKTEIYNRWKISPAVKQSVIKQF